MTPSCQARRYSDQMHCAKCRLAWDVNDPDPPLCGQQVATRDMQERLENSTGFVSALAPVNPLLTRPVAKPDYEGIRKRTSTRFSKTLAYLAK